MKDIITKESLNQTIELISALNLSEEDYEKLFEKFKSVLNYSKIKKILKIQEIKEEDNIEAIMSQLTRTVKLSDLNKFLKELLKSEELIDFVQDLFLEKLM